MRAGDRRRDQVELADEHAGDVERHVVDADVEAVDLGAPHQLGRALDDVGEAERRHEQRDRRLVDQRPEHGALDARSRAAAMAASVIAAATQNGMPARPG